MANKHPFPASLAKDKEFCNRKSERQQIKDYFRNNEHSVIVAPRRYGKTSLINQVVIDNKYPAISIDLLLASSSEFIKKAVQSSVAVLLAKIMPKEKAMRRKLIDKIVSMHPKLTINILGQKLELLSSQPELQTVVDMLLSVEAAAKQLKKKVIIIFDEFQQVGQIKDSKTIEASIRHAVERSKNVTYIFSGSHRNLLITMFTDSARPLYHLCELMNLERIHAEDYLPFLSKHLSRRWDQKIDDSVIDEILSLTACHAYYVNALCRNLWRLPSIPSVADVFHTWKKYIDSQSPWIINDLSNLTANQISILAALSHRATKEPLGSDFVHLVKLTPSSIKVSLNYLTKKDYVYQNTDGYYLVLDPAVAHYLRGVKHFGFV